MSLAESGISNAIIIADKGFYSKNNIELLQEDNLQFTILLRISNCIIDYSLALKESKTGYESYFQFNNRFVWYYSYKHEDVTVYLYLDGTLKQCEEHDYLVRIQTHPEMYNKDEFHVKGKNFGTLVLISNIKETNTEKLYATYKSRNNIE